jgi:hypothetical protein
MLPAQSRQQPFDSGCGAKALAGNHTGIEILQAAHINANEVTQ